MDEIKFVDATLRDGDSSLWGFTMTTGMILPVAKLFDQAGFEAIEPTDGLISIKTRVRDLHEEPWERMRLLSKMITKTPLSLMAGGSAGVFNVAPLSFRKLRLERLAANGISRVQITGFLNDMQFMVPETVSHAKSIGLEAVLGLVYTVSPKHTDSYYAQKTREAVMLNPHRLYLKDPGGLLTPERIKTLIPAILQNSNGVTFEFHSHCTTGLASQCYLEAIKCGVQILHTCIPPLANGPALPSVFNVAHNARLLGYNSRIDEGIVKRISDHFRFIAKKEGRPLGVPVEYDYGQYLHQIPGGVISNLKRQLHAMKMDNQMDAVLQETIQVREDLGYPIMVTPFAQHVVTQATINLMIGKRYQEVTDELIQYCVGYFGTEASSGVDPEVKEKIMDRPRARELAGQGRQEQSLDELRQQLGGADVSDDELVLRYMLGGNSDLTALRPAPMIKAYPLYSTPLTNLLYELETRRTFQHFKLKGNNFSLILRANKSSIP